MSDEDPIHLATIDWQRGKWAGLTGKYSREHTWHLSGGAKLKASDSPFMLPEGYRDNAKLDAEKLFVASVAASCAFLPALTALRDHQEIHGGL